MMKTRNLIILLSLLCLNCFSQTSNLKDFREVYLWDVTLSMQGYGGAPNIYDKVLDALVKDIQSITNERTEIVVVPFQDTAYCDVWRCKATPDGKEQLIEEIENFKNKNKKVTNTNISAPLEYAMNKIFSKDRIDILKLMTDGKDNVDREKLQRILSNWCDIAKDKDVYGYYILLTENAKDDQDLILKLKEICNFEVIDLEDNIEGLGDIVQVNAPFSDKGLLFNIRDEYDKPKKLQFTSYGNDIPEGYKIHFTIEDNPYVELDEVSTVNSDNTFTIHPKYKKSLKALKKEMPERVEDLSLNFESANSDNPAFNLTRLLNNQSNLSLLNKQEKSVQIYIK